MRRIFILTIIMMGIQSMTAQNVMTPEKLWKLGRLTALGMTKDGKNIVYKVATPSIEDNKSESKYYTISVKGGNPTEVTDYKALLADRTVSPDGKYIAYHEEVKIESVH